MLLEKYRSTIRQDMLVTLSKNFPLGEMEMNIFYMIVAMVKPDDLPGQEYTIPIKHIEALTGREQKISVLHEACRSLRRRELEINDPNLDFMDTGLLAEAYKIRGKETLKVSLSNSARRFYVNLKERFSSFQLENLLKLKGKHSKRLYILLSAFRDTGEFFCSLEDMIEILTKKVTANGDVKIAKYKAGNFKSEVLYPSQKEINMHTDVRFEIEDKKTGRKITHFKFLIEYSGEELDFVKEYRTNNDFIRLMEEFKLSAYQAKEVIDNLPSEDIRLVFRTIQLQNTNKQIRNMGGYTVKRLKEAYPFLNI